MSPTSPSWVLLRRFRWESLSASCASTRQTYSGNLPALRSALFTESYTKLSTTPGCHLLRFGPSIGGQGFSFPLTLAFRGGADRRPDFVVYTDAATSSLRIAALAFHRRGGAPYVFKLCVPTDPKAWRNHFHRKNMIMWLEMRAALSFLWPRPSIFKGQRVNLYIDNNTAANSIIRGDCAKPFVASMVCVFWKLVAALSVGVWIGRVGSKVNPADLPPRYTKLPFKSTTEAQFVNIYKLLRGALSFL